MLNPGTIALIVIGVFVVFVAIGLTAIYNRLVALRNRYRNAYAQIDVQLKRRYDLIPNLVESAKGYLAHERQTLEAVIAARNAAVSANAQAAARPGEPAAMTAVSGAEGALTAALGRLFALREAYPDLKADRTIAGLMEELTSTENRVAFARQAYNDAVMTYNTARESFPAVVLAGPMGFGEAQLFEVSEPAEREAVRVSFK